MLLDLLRHQAELDSVVDAQDVATHGLTAGTLFGEELPVSYRALASCLILDHVSGYAGDARVEVPEEWRIIVGKEAVDGLAVGGSRRNMGGGRCSEERVGGVRCARRSLERGGVVVVPGWLAPPMCEASARVPIWALWRCAWLSCPRGTQRARKLRGFGWPRACRRGRGGCGCRG